MPDEPSRARRSTAATGLRTAAVWAAVSDLAGRQAEHLGRPLRVLDLGGGSGGLAVPLAEVGHEVLVVDPSPDALASLGRRAAEGPAGGRISAHQGDADTLPTLVADGSIDLVCCHGTLEHVDDPASALARLATTLRPGGLVSVVSANRLAAVLSRALGGHFAQAQAVLTSADGRWGEGDPLPRRFDREGLVALVEGAGLIVDVVHPVRTFSDLVPSAATDTEGERAALLALEDAVLDHPAFAGLGSAVHVLAHR